MAASKLTSELVHAKLCQSWEMGARNDIADKCADAGARQFTL